MARASRLWIILVLVFSFSCSWAMAAPSQVLPGGQAVGLVINQEGLLVVKTFAIENQQGQKINPAQAAGIQPGDLILSINEQSVQKQGQITELLEQGQGQELKIRLQRNQQEKELSLTPILSAQSQQYRLGITVKEGVSGIGTLSFYNPSNNYYGALGHIINDAGQEIKIKEGKISGALIRGINPAQKGQPGEKLGCLEENSVLQGLIEKNTIYGVFGHLQQIPTDFFYSKPLPVAEVEQIKIGSAEMLTVLSGSQIEKFSIEIEQIQPNSQGRDLVIKITDPRILEQCGGIVQGMSGSPIIQNNRFVGAVTHVLVNDPSRGYAVLGEKMLQMSETAA